MKNVHLWATALEPAALAPLFAEAGKVGLRVGWLSLADTAACPSLEPAAVAGAFRAVSATSGRVVAVKPIAGAPVISDLVREYFAGCRLVLVSALADVPELLTSDSGYLLRHPDGGEKTCSATELVQVLRRPGHGRRVE